jgi:hypothetical protein
MRAIKMDAGILTEATRVVDHYLAVVEAEVGAKVIQRSGKYVCACHSCRAARRDTLAWLDAIQADNPEPRAA